MRGVNNNNAQQRGEKRMRGMRRAGIKQQAWRGAGGISSVASEEAMTSYL